MTVALSRKISEGAGLELTGDSLFPFAKPDGFGGYVAQTAAAQIVNIMEIGFRLQTGWATSSIRDRFDVVIDIVNDFAADKTGVTASSDAIDAAYGYALAQAATGLRVAIEYPAGIYWITRTPPRLTKGGISIYARGRATIRLYNPDEPWNSNFWYLGDPTLDPAPGESTAVPGRPSDLQIAGFTLRCDNELWLGTERIGPLDATANDTFVVAFSEVIYEHYNQGLLLNGRPCPVSDYTVSGFGTDTLTYHFPGGAPGGVLWALRQPETCWIFEEQGAVNTLIKDIYFERCGGWRRAGGHQRTTASRRLQSQGTFYVYNFPGSLRSEAAFNDDDDPDEEGLILSPHPGFVSPAANESADGSRTTFTFTLATPSGGVGTLVGIRELAYISIDGVPQPPDYDDTGWGTDTITVDFDVAPSGGAVVRLHHYVVPVGLPNSYDITHNEGPSRDQDGDWNGLPGDHRMGGAFREYRISNLGTPLPSRLGGATGDTKLIQHHNCQAFWPPWKGGSGWEGVTANEAADGSRTTFTFSFTAAVASGLLRVYVDGEWMLKGSFVPSGYGTSTITVEFAEPPEDGAEVTAQRRYNIDPVGKPFGTILEFTEGHLSNMVYNGVVHDHTTNCAFLIKTKAPVGDEYMGYLKHVLVMAKRFAVDDGQTFRVEADSDRPCANILFLADTSWARRDKPIIQFRGNHSGLCILGSFLGEVATSKSRFDRPALIEADGNGGWSVIGCRGGKLSAGYGVIGTSVIRVLNPDMKEFNASLNTFPSDEGGYAAFIEHPQVPVGSQALDADPLRMNAGSTTLAIRAVGHRLRVGDKVNLAGATGGAGLPADNINGDYIVSKIVGPTNFQVTTAVAADFSEVFGGSSITLSRYQADYRRVTKTLTNRLTVADGSAVVEIEDAGHDLRSGDIVNVVSVASPPGGLSSGDLTGYRPATVIDADHYTIQAGTAATGDAASAGGAVVLEYWGDRSLNRITDSNTPSSDVATADDIAQGRGWRRKVTAATLLDSQIPEVLPDQATITPDFGSRLVHEYEIDGNRTMAAPLRAAPGSIHTIILRQAGAGSNNITSWDAYFHFIGTSPTMATGVGAKTYIRALVSADGTYADTFLLAPLTATFVGGMPTSWTLTAGTGLTGGGDGSANRTIALDIPVTVARGGTGRTSLTGDQYLRGDGTNAIVSVSVGALGTDLGTNSAATPAQIQNGTAVGQLLTAAAIGNWRATTSTLTDGGSINWNINNGPHFSLTVGGNRTLNFPSNADTGKWGIIRVAQDSNGNRTLAYASGIVHPGGVVPVLKTGAGEVTYLVYWCRTTGEVVIWDLAPRLTSVNGQTGAVTVAVPVAGTATPLADGASGSAGTSPNWAPIDHVHPNSSAAVNQIQIGTAAGVVFTPSAWGAWRSAVTTLTMSGGNVNFNFNLTPHFQGTATGAHNFNNTSNATFGKTGYILIYQDGTGGHTPTLGANWVDDGITWNTSPNALTLIKYFCVSATEVHLKS